MTSRPRSTCAKSSDAIERVVSNPTIGRACNDVRPGYRKHAVGSHTLYYRIGRDDVIDVVRYSTNGWMPTGTSTEAMQWPRRLNGRSTRADGAVAVRGLRQTPQPYGPGLRHEKRKSRFAKQSGKTQTAVLTAVPVRHRKAEPTSLLLVVAMLGDEPGRNSSRWRCRTIR